MRTKSTIYGVRMFFNAVKTAPRVVGYLLFAVVLTLLVFAVAAASFLGLSLAVAGWATSSATTISPTTIHAPIQR